MDDQENKNVFDGNDEPEKTESPEAPTEEREASPVPEETAPESELLDDKELIESQLDDLVSQLKAKNEEWILKNDIQDWSGLVDDSRQDAEDFVLNESSDISEEKIEQIEVMEIDEDDERLCSICHRRLKLEKDGVTYEYCKRCRNELLETSYNWKSVVTFILSCVVFVFAVALSAVAIINSLGVSKAASLTEQKKLVSASNAYSTLLASSSGDSSYAPLSLKDFFGVNPGENTIRDYVKVLFQRGDLSTLKTVLDTYYSEDDFEKSQNSDIKPISEAVKGLYDVGNRATSIVAAFQGTITKEEADNAIAELEKMKDDESLDPIYLTYYQYYVTTMLQDGFDLQLEYLEKLKEEAPELKIFYVSSFASTYLYMGDYEKCIEYCDLALKDDVEDFTSWRLKIRALSRQKKYDEALALSQEALSLAKDIYTDSSDGSSPDVTYGHPVYLEQAIIYGIKGDMKKAQDAIDKAYQGQLTLDSAYLYAMINKKNGNDEAYDEVVNMLANYEMTLPTICDEYISGAKTLEEVLIDGKVAWYE